jgi:hypothetical protein
VLLGEEMGEALDILPEATKKDEAADSGPAASWNFQCPVGNEQYFSKVIQSCYDISALLPSDLPVSQTRELPKPHIPEQSSTRFQIQCFQHALISPLGPGVQSL